MENIKLVKTEITGIEPEQQFYCVIFKPTIVEVSDWRIKKPFWCADDPATFIYKHKFISAN